MLKCSTAVLKLASSNSSRASILTVRLRKRIEPTHSSLDEIGSLLFSNRDGLGFK